jgi:hypothetical protein
MPLKPVESLSRRRRRLALSCRTDLVATPKRVADHPGIIDVDRVRMRWVGHRLVADAAIRVPRS